MAKRNALGRGLGALMTDANEEQNPAAAIDEVNINNIVANPWQPRTTFDEEAMAELSRSIKEVGIIQPLTLRKPARTNIKSLPANVVSGHPKWQG